MKTIKELLEVYKPKAKDEQDFADKHVVIKHKDRNGNGDEVFNASKVKYNKRAAEHHGYDSGEDEKVYEEVEEFDEMSYAAASKRAEASRLRAIKKAAAAYKRHGDMDRAISDHDLFAKDAHKIKAHLSEEVDEAELEESYDELMRLKNNIARNRKKMNSIQGIHPDKKRLATKIESDTKKHKELFNKVMGKNESVEMDDLTFFEDLLEMNLDEDTFTDASLANLRVMKHKQKMKDIENSSKKHPLMKVRLMSGARKKLAELEKTRDQMVAKHEKATSKKKVAEEVEDLDEAVEVRHDRYMRSHGKKASGGGGWMFTHKQQGDAEGDDVFKAPSTSRTFTDAAKHAKAWAKSKGHRSVYVMEQIEDLDEKYLVHVKKNGQPAGTIRINAMDQENAEYQARNMVGKKPYRGYELHKVVKEEVEDLDEEVSHAVGDKVYLRQKFKVNAPQGGKVHKIGDTHTTIKVGSRFYKARHNDFSKNEEDGWYHKSLAPFIEKDKKRKAELRAKMNEAEQIDELSKKTLGSYAKRAADQKDRLKQDAIAASQLGHDMRKLDNNETGAQKMFQHAGKQIRKSVNRQTGLNRAIDKLTKEDIINRAIENYMPEDYTPPSSQERFLSRIDHLPESYAVTLLALFDSLNEDNQSVMIESTDTEEGINALLDFAINNRGE